MALYVTAPEEEEKKKNSEGSSSLAPEKKPQREVQESNVAKVSKQIDEFMAKVSGMMGQSRRTDTVLSGSQQDDSNDDQGR